MFQKLKRNKQKNKRAKVLKVINNLYYMLNLVSLLKLIMIKRAYKITRYTYITQSNKSFQTKKKQRN